MDESRAFNLIYCEKKGKSAKLWDDFFSCRCYLHPSDRSNVVSVNQFCNFTSITIHYSQWLRQYTPEYEMRSLIIMYKIMWDENLGQISLIIQINAIFYLCYFITNVFLALDMYLYSNYVDFSITKRIVRYSVCQLLHRMFQAQNWSNTELTHEN